VWQQDRETTTWNGVTQEMINPFEKKHLGLSTKNKKRYWSLKKKGNHNFVYHLDDLDFYLKLNTSDDSVAKKVFFGNYEKGTCRFIQKILRGGEVVYDIGANIGFYTILFSRLVGDTGKIHAFEPSQREYHSLCENISLNKLNNVVLNQLGISNQNTLATLNVLKDEKFGAYNTLGKVTHHAVRNAEINQETIRLTTLDSYFENYSSKIPNLLKVDVEGVEKLVFQGGRSILKSEDAPLIVCEICEETLEGTNSSSEEICQLLKQYGYSIYNLDNDGNISEYKKSFSQNAVAIKEFHFQRIRSAGIEIIPNDWNTRIRLVVDTIFPIPVNVRWYYPARYIWMLPVSYLRYWWYVVKDLFSMLIHR